MDENSSNLCFLPGRPELYGVGIRTAFYIQWLGSLMIEFITEDYLVDMRFISVFSSAAALTALIIGAAQGKLYPLDVYFLLLFAMGFFLFQIPLRTWQLLTRSVRRIRRKHIKRLRILRILSGFVVFTLLVLAIELPICWNHIDNVTEFETLAQLIPFFLSIGLFFRTWAMWIIRERPQEQDWDDSLSVATTIDPRDYWDRYNDYGEYGYGDYNWPHIPQWPPNVYYTARSI
ncbi:hypothetical protein CEP53_008782 [Fusarium sp. AF-6]|nr:hypothetical protein CEP53_008782 [Fusarium sp. AF-6]